MSDHLEKVVRKIYKEAGGGGAVMAFGPRREELPQDWQEWFEHRKQDQTAPEAEEKEGLIQILEEVAKRLDELDKRLSALEELSDLEVDTEELSEEIEKRQEIRKGIGELEAAIDLAVRKGEMKGICGEFVKGRRANG